jgi:hypothetical protein
VYRNKKLKNWPRLNKGLYNNNNNNEYLMKGANNGTREWQFYPSFSASLFKSKNPPQNLVPKKFEIEYSSLIVRNQVSLILQNNR